MLQIINLLITFIGALANQHNNKHLADALEFVKEQLIKLNTQIIEMQYELNEKREIAREFVRQADTPVKEETF